MATEYNRPASTVIISVYQDAQALRLILDSLQHQTSKDFEVIVSEDCQSDEIRNCVRDYEHTSFAIRHLSQLDDGFRKNIALNRAIRESNAQHIIFIDGDCIPHPHFIEAHQQHAAPGITCTGRRLELGETVSSRLRKQKIKLDWLTGRLCYLFHLPALLQDKAKNIESGLYSQWLHRLTENKEIRLLGCNFSCHKHDLIKINGFNEDYRSPGIGEDSDIDWRLTHSGVKIKNVKFSAVQYHLHHPRSYTVSEKNRELFAQTKNTDSHVCKHGIQKNDDRDR